MSRDVVIHRIYSDYLYYAFSFILPLLFLAVANGLVTYAYRRAQGRRRRLVVTARAGGGGGGGGGECKRSITLVMILVVLLFILCQAPARFIQIMWSYTFHHCHQLRYFIIHTSNMLEVLNSSLNFVERVGHPGGIRLANTVAMITNVDHEKTKCAGTEFTRRKDDNEETVRTRMAEYRAKTAPILPIYDARGIVARVDGMGDMDAVTAGLESALAD